MRIGLESSGDLAKFRFVKSVHPILGSRWAVKHASAVESSSQGFGFGTSLGKLPGSGSLTGFGSRSGMGCGGIGTGGTCVGIGCVGGS